MSKNGGMMNVIRCDMQSYLVWKWRPFKNKDDEEDPNQRSNAIRMGSSLRVKDGEMAIFVYSKKDGGSNQEVIFGPFDDIIKTSNFPILANLVGLAYGGGSPFQAECYFINLANNIQIKFGVPYFDVFDPRFPDLGVPVAVRGVITFKITDYKNFIANNRLINFSLDSFKEQIKALTIRTVKSKIISYPTSKNIPLVQIEGHIGALNDHIKDVMSDALKETFGVTVRSFDLEAINIDQRSQNYIDLKKITFDIIRDTTRRQAELNLRNLEDTQRINMGNMEETLRIQRQEMQRAQRLQTESANLAAHQVNRQAQVMTAMADGLAGSAMGGGINNGMNPINMMTGIAVGGAMGTQMGNMINQMGNQWSNQMNTPDILSTQPGSGMPQMAPPSLPTVLYYAYINNTQNGPLNIDQIKQLISQGILTPNSLVWKEGMASWDKAENTDLCQFFLIDGTPPPLPPSIESPNTPPITN